MRIKKARQILKSMAEDTRLRIINLLNKSELNVTELCAILKISQSSTSKHLTRLRLTGLVGDKRRGTKVYYYLSKPENKAYKELIKIVTVTLSEMEVFREDVERMNTFKKQQKKKK